MTISRGQMERQLRMGGGIMDVVPREPAIFGGIKKAVKKVGKTVKKIASSDLGKAALIGAAAFGIPGTQMGGIFGRASFGGFAPGMFEFGGIGNALAAGKAKFLPSSLVDADDVVLASQKALGKAAGDTSKSFLGGNIGKLATLGAVSTFLTQSLGMTEEQAEAELARDPSTYLEQYYRNLNPPTADTTSEEYEKQVRDFVTTNTSEYAVGGRVGFDEGSPRFDDIDFGSMQEIMPELELKDDKSIPMPELKLEEDILVPGPDGKIRVKPIPMPGSKGKPLGGIENLQASVQLELPFGEPLFVVKQAGRLFGVFEQKDGSRILLPMDKSGSRLDLADAGPVLPPDPTQPVNPFGPKPPADAPVLPDRMMASNIENDKILEALFEKYIDMGLSPKEAAERAKEEFDRMSNMRIEETRGLAALGGRMGFDEGTSRRGLMGSVDETMDIPMQDEDTVVIITMDENGMPVLKQVPRSEVMPKGVLDSGRTMKAKGDTASDNAMQAAGIEGLPIRQNPKGVKELDLRETGGFIQPVGIKEKEDDIPAMLSNNEFVFTADAVRGMGDGNVNVGAQRMYDMMKKLEAGGRV
jgi:hypothetical protein